MKARLGLIGLGEMGMVMAENLLKKGYPLAVFDLDQKRVKRLVNLGASAVSGPDQVAENSDLLLIIVRTTEQVRCVLFGENGVVSASSLPSAIAVMSTISPVDARKMAKPFQNKGIGFIDAPVSGARLRAESGDLTIMVGGDSGIYRKFLPIFKVIGRHVVHVGSVGAGQTAKLVNNMLLLINMCVAHEAKTLIEDTGMDHDTIFDLIRVSTGQSWVIDNWDTVAGWRQLYSPGTTLDLLYEDIDITLQLGEKHQVPLYLSALAKQLLRY